MLPALGEARERETALPKWGRSPFSVRDRYAARRNDQTRFLSANTVEETSRSTKPRTTSFGRSRICSAARRPVATRLRSSVVGSTSCSYGPSRARRAAPLERRRRHRRMRNGPIDRSPAHRRTRNALIDRSRGDRRMRNIPIDLTPWRPRPRLRLLSEDSDPAPSRRRCAARHGDAIRDALLRRWPGTSLPRDEQHRVPAQNSLRKGRATGVSEHRAALRRAQPESGGPRLRPLVHGSEAKQ
jgi:hypothetical protein